MNLDIPVTAHRKSACARNLQRPPRVAIGPQANTAPTTASV
jgi:hypothetical protein